MNNRQIISIYLALIIIILVLIAFLISVPTLNLEPKYHEKFVDKRVNNTNFTLIISKVIYPDHIYISSHVNYFVSLDISLTKTSLNFKEIGISSSGLIFWKEYNRSSIGRGYLVEIGNNRDKTIGTIVDPYQLNTSLKFRYTIFNLTFKGPSLAELELYFSIYLLLKNNTRVFSYLSIRDHQFPNIPIEVASIERSFLFSLIGSYPQWVVLLAINLLLITHEVYYLRKHPDVRKNQ